MGVQLQALGETADPQSLISNLKNILQDLEDQLGQRANLYTSLTGSIPPNLSSGDVVFTMQKGSVSIYLANSKGSKTLVTAAMLLGLLAHGTNFKGVTTSNALPTTTDYPANFDWGFHNRTGGSPALYLVFNLANVIKKVQLT